MRLLNVGSSKTDCIHIKASEIKLRLKFTAQSLRLGTYIYMVTLTATRQPGCHNRLHCDIKKRGNVHISNVGVNFIVSFPIETNVYYIVYKYEHRNSKI